MIAFLLLLLTVVAQAGDASSMNAMVSPGYLALPHQDLGCDACHLPFEGLPARRCIKCHTAIGTDRQRPETFHGKHADQPCTDCHTDHHGTRASLTRDSAVSDFDHSLTDFPLEGKHAHLSCARCHDRPLEKLNGCVSCHDDPHEGNLGDECGACHTASGWHEQRHPLEAHKLDMRGPHGTLQCEDCHLLGAVLDESPTCNECHEQAHGGTKASCDRCHTVLAWKPARFNHDPCGCEFPGKHQTAPCLSCHVKFDFVNTPTRCESCHRKDLKHDFIGGCARCHTTTSWTERIFDHNKNTHFPIDGAHLGVACKQCHPTGFGQANKACVSCHDIDEWAGHPPLGPCEKCHTTTTGWEKSLWSHASTGFPLTGTHAKESCWACHPNLHASYLRFAPGGG